MRWGLLSRLPHDACSCSPLPPRSCWLQLLWGCQQGRDEGLKAAAVAQVEGGWQNCWSLAEIYPFHIYYTIDPRSLF